MKKKILCGLLSIVIVASMSVAFVACDNSDDKYTIVYIGDSIAEALIGPSPLGERDNYGYYALVGRINDFKYYNHSISGHKTSTGIVSGDGLLEVLQRKDENAVLMKSHLQEADMIHISVLGNNILQYNLGLMMLEVADPYFEQKYEEGKTATHKNYKTLINALEDGSLDDPLYRDSVEKFDSNGRPEQVKFDFPPTYRNICEIVARLKELNPHATIVFQKVYNPFFEGSKHLSPEVFAKLAEITDTQGRFGEAGQKITTIAQVRKLADYLLGKLNGMLDRYLEEHPDSITILDAAAAFDKVVALDKKADGTVNLDKGCFGRKLIFEDWTHPSNMGHAVIAGLTQDLLVQMKVASPNAVANYKAIKKEQIDRLFKPIDDFNAEAAVAAIDSAETFLDVTLAYFRAIDGFTPVY